MSETFRVNNDFDPVEIPELSAYLADLLAVCERHGIGFEVNGYNDYDGYLVLIPFEKMDQNILINDLERSTVPCINAIYVSQSNIRHDRYLQEEKARQTQRDALLKQNGMIIGGKLYKFVQVES